MDRLRGQTVVEMLLDAYILIHLSVYRCANSSSLILTLKNSCLSLKLLPRFSDSLISKMQRKLGWTCSIQMLKKKYTLTKVLTMSLEKKKYNGNFYHDFC